MCVNDVDRALTRALALRLSCARRGTGAGDAARLAGHPARLSAEGTRIYPQISQITQIYYGTEPRCQENDRGKQNGI